MADRITELPLSPDEREEPARPSAIEINDLVLIPTQYKSSTDLDGYLSINARFLLSNEQYANIGRLPNVVQVVRRGNDVDEAPRKMNLTEIAWSKRGNEIHEEISLCDKDNILSSFTCLDNSVALVVKQGMIIDDLIKMLVSAKIISQSQIDGLMAEITDEKVNERARGLNQLKNDLDDYEF